MAHCELRRVPFDPWQVLAEWSAAQQHAQHYGATAVFVGTMRDFNDGNDVVAMYLEHYPGMTERQLEQIARSATSEWRLDDVLIIHRVGEILPTESIVLVGVWSAHRAEAFTACRHIMETLKHKAPFWKRETLVDGSLRWVTQNTQGEV